jgi:glycosyltransferase involved in cell wall biosynthesis
MSAPRVSVLCLCYNHAQYVEEAIQSVLAQTYQSIQLIILDDGSDDESVAIIKKNISFKSEITFLVNETNQGYTKSLNKALSKATGEFIIDLAADDILLPDRIAEGVKELEKAGSTYGVNFTDAYLIDEQGKEIGKHSDKYAHVSIPTGDIYKDVIHRYFICSPTLMFRKQVIEYIGGYDETLAFEDFDFIIRASRSFQFCYTPKPLLKKRLLSTAMSQRQFRRGSDQRVSTLRICQKIEKLNRTQEEVKALKRRVRYEIVLSLKLFDFSLAVDFLKFYLRLSSPSTMLT